MHDACKSMTEGAIVRPKIQGEESVEDGVTTKCLLQDLFADAEPAFGSTDMSNPHCFGRKGVAQEVVPIYTNVLTARYYAVQGSWRNWLNDIRLYPIEIVTGFCGGIRRSEGGP